MHRRRIPSVERFKAQYDVLRLEFHVGPPRRPAPIDSARLERALVAANHGLGLAARSLDSPDTARFVSAIYDLLGEDAAAAKNVERILDLIDTASAHWLGEPCATAPGAQPRRTEGDARVARGAVHSWRAPGTPP